MREAGLFRRDPPLLDRDREAGLVCSSESDRRRAFSTVESPASGRAAPEITQWPGSAWLAVSASATGLMSAVRANGPVPYAIGGG
jgi:hypothetical protein